VREKQTNDLLGRGLMKDCDIDPWWLKVSHAKFQEKKKLMALGYTEITL